MPRPAPVMTDHSRFLRASLWRAVSKGSTMNIRPAPTRAEELKSQALAKFERAKSIAENADRGGRDLTANESHELRTLLDDGKALAAKAQEAAASQDASQSLTDALAGVDFGTRSGSGTPSGRPDHGWGKAMRQHLAQTGQKTIAPSGSITVPSLDATIQTNIDRPRSVLSEIPIATADTGQVSYLREQLRQHEASTVAQGHLKPRSIYELVRIDDHARTVAHLSDPVPNQLLADSPQVEQYLDGVLREGLALELERLVVDGDGDVTGGLDNFTGLLQVSGRQTQVFATDRWVTSRKAITTIEATNVEARGLRWVLSPAAWEAFELTKDDESYVLGGAAGTGERLPLDRSARRLWGVPVVVTTAMEGPGDDVALLGDLGGSCRLRLREQTQVSWSEAVQVALPGDSSSMTATAWETNQKVWRAELRATLEIFRPSAFCEVALTSG